MVLQNPTLLDDLPKQPGSRILRAAEVEAWQEGYRFLALARKAAAKTEQDARSAHDAAYANGFAEGRAAGVVEANRLLRDTTLSVHRYISRLENEISTLVLGIVRRVIGEIDVADLVAHAATQAMTEFRQEKQIKVAVHPSAADRVSVALAAFAHNDRPSIIVEPDPALDEGACVLVSDVAVVDASIEVQMRALEESLTFGAGEHGETR